jgi:hypothetical protein
MKFKNEMLISSVRRRERPNLLSVSLARGSAGYSDEWKCSAVPYFSTSLREGPWIDPKFSRYRHNVPSRVTIFEPAGIHLECFLLECEDM